MLLKNIKIKVGDEFLVGDLIEIMENNGNLWPVLLGENSMNETHLYFVLCFG